MSDLVVSTKKLDELYEEWRGNKPAYDNGVGLFDAAELLDFAEFCLKHKANGISTSDEALPIADVVERKAGRITVSFFRKVYKQFIDEEISMTKMLELMTEQAHRTDVCIKCQRPLDGTNCSKDKCNACFTVNA